MVLFLQMPHPFESRVFDDSMGGFDRIRSASQGDYRSMNLSTMSSSASVQSGNFICERVLFSWENMQFVISFSFL